MQDAIIGLYPLLSFVGPSPEADGREKEGGVAISDHRREGLGLGKATAATFFEDATAFLGDCVLDLRGRG
jgi:hypothetical protein